MSSRTRPLLTLPAGACDLHAAAQEFARSHWPGPRTLLAYQDLGDGAACFLLVGLGCWYRVELVGAEYLVWRTEERQA